MTESCIHTTRVKKKNELLLNFRVGKKLIFKHIRFVCVYVYAIVVLNRDVKMRTN